MNTLYEKFTSSSLVLKVFTDRATPVVIINDISFSIVFCNKRGAIVENSSHWGIASNLSFSDTFSDTYRKSSKALYDTDYLSGNLASNNTLRTNLMVSVLVNLMTSSSNTLVSEELIALVIEDFISIIGPSEILSQLAMSKAVEKPILFADYCCNLKLSIESSLGRKLHEQELKKVTAFAADYLSSKKSYSKETFEDCFNFIDLNQDKFALCE